MTFKDRLFKEMFNVGKYVAYVGCDPEFLYEAPDGTLIPSFSVLSEKKEDNDAHVPYVDGWQGEFGTDPTHCIAYMVDDIHYALQAAAAAIGDKGVISTRSVIEVDLSRLAEHPEHGAFGCTPSLNAYGDYAHAMDGMMVPFRMAGGHIHLGIPKDPVEQKSKMRGTRGLPDARAALDSNHKEVVKVMDRVVGVVGAALFYSVEDVRRRLLYGRAGEYRLPEHGLEYRVPSNAWLLHPALSHFYVYLTRHACAMALHEIINGRDPSSIIDTTDTEVIAAINESNPVIARSIIERNKEVFEYFIQSACVHRQDVVNIIWKAMSDGGVTDLLPDNYTLYKAWSVKGASNKKPSWVWLMHSEAENCCIGRSCEAARNTGKLGVTD